MVETHGPECWFPLKKNSNYLLSNYGRAKNKKTGHILKPHEDKDGYHTLNLGYLKNAKVHRLVCESVYGPPVGACNEVNHKDGNRQNNHAKNLEWCTREENMRWSVEHGNLDYARVTPIMQEYRKKPVYIVETGEVFESATECARRLGISHTSICEHLTGKRKGQAFRAGYHIDFVNNEEV